MHNLIWSHRPLRIETPVFVFKKQREAEYRGQTTDQLLPHNDTRVWTVDGGMIPFEGQGNWIEFNLNINFLILSQYIKLLMGIDRVESNSVCNHEYDYKQNWMI